MTALAATKLATDFDGIYTADEYEKLRIFDYDCELIDGTVAHKPLKSDVQRACGAIVRQLWLFDPSEKHGTIWSELSVRLGNKNVLIPDLLFVSADRVPKSRNPKVLNIVPDIVVELLSSSNGQNPKTLKATRQKVRMYQLVGVNIVWLINLHTQKAEIYHKNQLEPVESLGIDQELDGENVIPAFKIALNKVFTKQASYYKVFAGKSGIQLSVDSQQGEPIDSQIKKPDKTRELNPNVALRDQLQQSILIAEGKVLSRQMLVDLFSNPEDKKDLETELISLQATKEKLETELASLEAQMLGEVKETIVSGSTSELNVRLQVMQRAVDHIKASKEATSNAEDSAKFEAYLVFIQRQKEALEANLKKKKI